MNSNRRFLRNFIKSTLNFVVLLASFVLVFSCVTQKDVEYLQDKNKEIKNFSEAQIGDYTLKPQDELYIQINSLDEASANIFSSSTTQQNMYVGSIQPYGAYLIAYTIDKDGYLRLPVIGNLLVKDKTLAQVSTMLQESLANILSQPLVSVKLVNRYVSVLGEVRNPGHFAYAQDKLTIYDAIGLAGDITDYGNRKEVILTRNENGKNIRINVDLSKSDILASDLLYIRPNDVVYIKPLRKKFWDLRQFPYSVVLGTITTALLIYTVITQ
jgi:polysaccharide biosynthesis/export protein